MSFFDRFRVSPRKEEVKVGDLMPVEQISISAQTATERRNRKRRNARLGATALIIDDSPTVVAVLRKILRSAGYVTRDAGDAERGLAMIAEAKPDIVFLDIVLPGMNGFGALRAIRKDPSTQHIPVVMISGNEHAIEQFYANKIGADDFMKKPFSRSEVFAHIEILLDSKRLLSRKGAVEDGANLVVRDVQEELIQTLPVARTAASLSAANAVSTATDPLVTQWPALEARKQLTAMGLLYFDAAQFLAAIRRKDELAVTLFVAGKGVVLDSTIEGKTLRTHARDLGNAAIIQLVC